MNRNRPSAMASKAGTRPERGHLHLGRVLTMAVFCAFLAHGAAQAQAVDCTVFARAAEAGKTRAKNQISAQEAATQESLDAAKQCLANIDRSLNALIPGIRFTIDFSGILRGMINRACQVVTTKIDATGQVINGTVSDYTNRVIAPISGTLPPGTVGGGGGTGVGGGPLPGGGLGGGFTTPSPVSPGIPAGGSGSGGGGSNLACRLTGMCK